MSRAEDIARWMRRQVSSAGARGLIVELSGSVDSAVVIRLAQLATPGAVIGGLLPFLDGTDDERDARVVAQHFSVPTVRINLSSAERTLASEARAALEGSLSHMRAGMEADPLRVVTPLSNMKPRLRMTALYVLADSLNYVVAGTANRSDLAIGSFTKYGDGGVDLLPLGGLVETEVRALARDLGVPGSIIDRVSNAGSDPGDAGAAGMGFTHSELERYLAEGPQAVAPALAMKIERLIRSNEHKLRLPAVPE